MRSKEVRESENVTLCQAGSDKVKHGQNRSNKVNTVRKGQRGSGKVKQGQAWSDKVIQDQWGRERSNKVKEDQKKSIWSREVKLCRTR